MTDTFQCFICRKDEHKWPKCPLLKHWNIFKKEGHPRPNESKNDSSSSDSQNSSAAPARQGKANNVTSSLPLQSTDPSPVTPPQDVDGAKSITFEDLTNANPFSTTGDESGVIDSSSLRKVGNVSNVYTSSSSLPPITSPITCVVDSGASRHMCNRREAFVTFTPTPNAYVEVANDEHAPCVGIGNAVFYMRDKLVLLSDVLCVPSLTNCLFAVSSHRRSKIKDCGFISLNNGIYLQFPSFQIRVDDDEECTVPVRFLPSLDNRPSLDFDFTHYKIASAAPVHTRSMSRNSPTSSDPVVLDHISMAPPILPSSDSPNSSIENEGPVSDSEEPSDPVAPAHPPKPTKTTPVDRPSLPVYYKQFSSHPSNTRFTTHQLHTLLGNRSLNRWKDLDEMAAPTISVAESCALPLELGDVTNLRAARKNKIPVPVHCDIGCGYCKSVGVCALCLLFC